jgi:hypothetical protein
LCGESFLRRIFKVVDEFVEPMLAEDAAAKQFVDPVAGLPEVDAGAKGASCCETVGATFGPVLAQEHKQRILRWLKRVWPLALQGGSRRKR